MDNTVNDLSYEIFFKNRVKDKNNLFIKRNIAFLSRTKVYLNYKSIVLSRTKVYFLNPIQDGLFRGCSRMGRGGGFLPKIRHTYPTMIKLGTVIPCLRKIQKKFKPRDRSLEFC